jgi:hypothetical protein
LRNDIITRTDTLISQSSLITSPNNNNEFVINKTLRYNQIDNSTQTESNQELLDKMYRSPYELLISERQSVEQCIAKLKKDELLALEKINKEENDSLYRLQQSELKLKENYESLFKKLEKDRKELDQARLKLTITTSKANNSFKLRTAELMKAAKELHFHQGILTNERQKLAKQRLHLSISLENLHNLPNLKNNNNNSGCNNNNVYRNNSVNCIKKKKIYI